MEKRRIVAIQTRTMERWTIMPVSKSDPRPCDECGSADWLTMGEAAVAARLPIAEICQKAGDGRLHCRVGPGGNVDICLRSLENEMKLTRRER